MPSTGPRGSTRGGRKTPPFRNVTGGASATQSSGPQQSLSPATPKLAPRPWDPVRVSTTDAVALLLLPPALTFVHPAVYLPASMDLRPPHPRQEFRKPPRRPPLPLLPTATTTPTTSAASKPQGNHHQSTTSRGPPSMCRRRPCRPGWGGQEEGRRIQQSVAPGSRSQSVRTSARLFPCCHHCRRGLGGGGAPAALVAGRGGSDGRGSSSGDNDMFCCGIWSDVVFLVWWWCELHAVRDYRGMNDVVCGVGMKK